MTDDLYLWGSQISISMKVAVVGVTGLVGRVLLQVLEERDFPVSELIPVASERSRGTAVPFGGRSLEVVGLSEALEKAPDLALFSAGGDISREWAPAFAEKGTTVIDNSSAFRMDSEKKLIVPEVNGDLLSGADRIIANPNCSTIQMVVALAPLHAKYGVKRVVVATYQSITGSGQKAVDQFANERKGNKGEMAYPYPIDRNCLPHCGDFDEEGYTKEETKLVNETRKILDEGIGVSATAVRVPVEGGHSEAVNVELERDFDLKEVRDLLSEAPGVQLQDNPDVNLYPMPLYAEGKDAVFVGRLRRDPTAARVLNLWVVADNLRKGAATNAVQIAEKVSEMGFVASA